MWYDCQQITTAIVETNDKRVSDGLISKGAVEKSWSSFNGREPSLESDATIVGLEEGNLVGAFVGMLDSPSCKARTIPKASA